MTLITHSFNQRRAGVLLHITSLPNSDLGEDAFRFVDFLTKIGASVWQTLPLNMTNDDGSPYLSLSAHAGNPNLISLDELKKQGLLSQSELDLGKEKSTLIAMAFANFKRINAPSSQEVFIDFTKRQSHWLDDFALFIVLRKHQKSISWCDWPSEIKLHQLEAIEQVQEEFCDEIELEKFKQFIFFEQWHALKKYANSKNIALFGDIPIFISYHSADVWARPDLFKLDSDLNMTVVAGVPPDYFSETGQRWGNPHYDWDAMQSDGFAWWLARMRTQNDLFDMIRIDHFRGLEAAWEIPAINPTAITGRWVEAPGKALLTAIKHHLPLAILIAEDLGIITSEVDTLRNAFDLPGMKVLQFAFDGSQNNPYLPNQIPENSVVYTGTHDNDTSLGWFLSLTKEQKYHFFRYLQEHLNRNESMIQMPSEMVDLAFSSKAYLAIIPMQDILYLGSESRMNTPGKIENNWQWKFEWSQLSSEMELAFMHSIQKHHRNPAISKI